MDHIVHKLQAAYPDFTFIQGAAAFWSPREKTIHYTIGNNQSIAGLMHELAHALLLHTTYTSDVDLLHKEIAAWELASKIAGTYALIIDTNHIQDCLDTYRDWLHKRSTCPACRMNGIQTDVHTYNCLNCAHTWHVSGSRFCRPYRRSTGMKKDRNNVPILSRFS
jgi:hypothetical protein